MFEHNLSATATHGVMSQAWHAGKTSGITVSEFEPPTRGSFLFNSPGEPQPTLLPRGMAPVVPRRGFGPSSLDYRRNFAAVPRITRRKQCVKDSRSRVRLPLSMS